MSEFEEVTDYTPSSENGVAIRAGNGFSTALIVQQKRNMQMVQHDCLEEAAIAGEDFIYSWKAGKGEDAKMVEGITIGAAMCVFRNMGNNALDVRIEETPEAYYFIGTYIDLEKGSNLRRIYRQNKTSPKTKYGKEIYSGDRAQDIIFQIGQSKCQRNVIANAVPKYLVSQIIEKAKENVRKGIEKMGVEKAKSMLNERLAALKIPLELVELTYGKMKGWDTVKLVQISSGIRAIENGYESVDDVFPREAGVPSESMAQAAMESLEKKEAKKEERNTQNAPDAGSAPMPTEPPPTSAEAEPTNTAQASKAVDGAVSATGTLTMVVDRSNSKPDVVSELGLVPVDAPKAAPEPPKSAAPKVEKPTQRQQALENLTDIAKKATDKTKQEVARRKIKMILGTGNITADDAEKLYALFPEVK